MVRFKWQVTDDISKHEFTFDPKTEPVEIAGEFQMIVNGINFGIYYDYPESARFKIIGDENILLVLDQFINEVSLLKESETIDVLFLQNCLDKHTMTKEGKCLFFRQYHRDTGKEDWCIRIDFNEFVEETKRSVKLFIDYIKSENPSLLENESILKIVKAIE